MMSSHATSQEIQLRLIIFILAICSIGLVLWPENPEFVETEAPKPVQHVQLQSIPQAESSVSEKHKAFMEQIRRDFAVGNFGKALRELQEMRTSTPENKSPEFWRWLEEQEPILQVAHGWTLLKLNQCDDAKALFLQALAKRRIQEAHKGLGICDYRAGKMFDAKESFEEARRIRDDDKDVILALSDVLESLQKTDAAVEVLREWNEKHPDNQLVERFKLFQDRAEEGSLQSTEESHHFRVSYRDVEHKDLVYKVVQSLEDTLSEFVSTYGFRFPSQIIEVTLFPSKQFENLIAGGPSWAEGIFDGRIRIPVPEDFDSNVNYLPSLNNVLRHELVHALLASMTNRKRLPTWFEEGLAQHIGERVRSYFSINPKPLLDQETLEARFVDMSSKDASAAYKQSAFLVAHLINQFGPASIERILIQLRQPGSVSSDRILKPFGVNFTDFHQAMAKKWEDKALPQ